MTNAIITKHQLDFEACEWESALGVDENFIKFRIGTCEGLWQSTARTYDILAITNNVPGNGHFEDVLQWFEYSCKRDKKDLRFLEVWNKRLWYHLLTKRKFRHESRENLIKKLKNMR
jgi:hypothetical protein